MKYVKVLGLLAVAAAAMAAFAATASATTITSPTGTTYTGKITATSTSSSLDGAFSTVTCKSSHVEGEITSHGSGVTVKGHISTLSFGECNFPVTVNKPGTLELHAIRPKGTSPHETCLAGEPPKGDGDTCWGTLTSSGAEVTIETSVGNCVFTTNNTGIGTVTPTSQTGGTPIFHIEGSIPRTGGSFLCGSSGTWTGTYTVHTPDNFWIDE